MALRMDPELLARLSRSGPLGQPGPPVGDIVSRRKNLTEGMAAIAASRQPMPGIDRTDVSIAAADGAEGVARAEELRPDVVLMDVKMPGMDGIDALRRLRELDNPARVLIVSAPAASR